MSLAGYTRLPTGEFTRDSDGSGPYVFDGTTMTLTATGSGGGGGGAVTMASGAVASGAYASGSLAAGAVVQLPATVGVKTSALSLSVAPSSDGTFLVAGATATRTDKSGTITSGGTAQTAIASNAVRKGFELQNQSTGNLWFSTLATAVQGQPSVLLPPGAYYETPLGGAGTGAVSIIGATTGQAFMAREWT